MLMDSTRESRHVEHPCSSIEGLRLFSPEKLGMDVKTNLVIFAVCGARPHPRPQMIPFISGSSQTPEHCTLFIISHSY